MTITDKNEIKELIADKFEVFSSKNEEHFAIIDMKLDRIETQTTLL